MGKTYCCSDLHGQYEIFTRIKKIMKEDDVCYILGDVVDRGEGSIKILMEVMCDRRFKMLRGNHEQLMLDALEENDYYFWYSNGGDVTHMELSTYSPMVESQIISFLRKLPYHFEYENKILTHAGFNFLMEDLVLNGQLRDTIMWDRSHIDSVSQSKRGKIQVHGHTPCQSIKEGHDKMLQYHPQKYCIDTGCCFGFNACLLDLDTLTPIYIDVKKTEE